MTSGSRETGADYLVRKSDLAKSRKELPAFTDILIVEDETMDANRLIATLRSLFGYNIEVRRAKTASSAVDMVLKRAPELVLLDDWLKPVDRATDTIPMIRRANFNGPIVIISGELNRDRRKLLIAKGATDAIHKDDLNSVAIAEVLTRIMAAGVDANGSASPATRSTACAGE
jgi:DNA-binding response OmpR family regulator